MKRAALWLVLTTLALPWSAVAGGGGPRLAAPDFVVTDLSGQHVSLRDLRGEVVIVLFGDLACAVCRENDRLLRDYQFEYLSHGLTHGLTVVSLHEHASLAELERYDQGFASSTLTGLDPGQAIARRYGALPLPTTVFIDREGNIRGVYRGRLEERDLLRTLQTLL